MLKEHDLTPIEGGISAFELLKRPHVTIELIEPFLENFNASDDVKQQLEITIKYEGYINKQIKEAESKDN